MRPLLGVAAIEHVAGAPTKKAGPLSETGPFGDEAKFVRGRSDGRKQAPLVRKLEASEEAIEAHDVAVVVAGRRIEQRGELWLVAESEIVPGC